MVCGARITYSYMRIGGVSGDLPPEFTPALIKFINEMPGYIDEYEALLRENEIIISRTKDMAILPPDTAINASVSGPMLRASGWTGIFEKRTPTRCTTGLNSTCRSGLRGTPTTASWCGWRRCGERPNRQAGYGADTGRAVQGEGAGADQPPKGEAYAHMEAPKGELGFYPCERRGDISLSVQDTGAILHKPDGVAGAFHRVEAGGPDSHPGQRGHQHG